MTSAARMVRDDLLSAVESAVRAPSVHNTQPWLFRLTDDGAVDVYADRSRQLRVADPTGTALRVSCGAAILNLRLAFVHRGHEPTTDLLPDPAQPDLLARVGTGAPRPATPAEASLYAAIGRRHSSRRPFIDTSVPLDVRNRLVRAAQAEGAWLDLMIGPAAIGVAAGLVRAADRILTANQSYVDEIAAWTGDGRVDGVPREAGGPMPEPYDVLAMRDFGGEPRADGRDYENEPLVCVLGSHGESSLDDLVAGQALQRVLLTATANGLMTSLLSQPIEVARVREELRIGLRRYGRPQMLLRAGYGIPGAPTSRRPLADVLLPPAAGH